MKTALVIVIAILLGSLLPLLRIAPPPNRIAVQHVPWEEHPSMSTAQAEVLAKLLRPDSSLAVPIRVLESLHQD